MPVRAPRICSCGRKVPFGILCACQVQRRATHEAKRGSARDRGYDREWEVARGEFLARPENRYCICGCGKRADTVNHKKPHRGDKHLFWDRGNWEPMAFACHSSVTASKDGGYGNRVRS